MGDRRRRADGDATCAAADPRDAVRLDRDVQRQEWVNGTGGQRVDLVRRPRPRALRRLALPHDPRARGRAIGGPLGRRVRRGEHRAALSGGVLRVESWSGYSGRTSCTRSSARTCSCFRERSTLLVRRDAPQLRRLGTYFWFYSGSEDRCAARTGVRRRAPPARFRIATGSSSAATTGRSGAGTHGRLPRGGEAARAWVGRPLDRGAGCSRSRCSSRRRAGSTFAAPGRSRGRASTTRSRSTSSRTAPASRSSSTSPVWAVAAVLARVLARWAGADGSPPGCSSAPRSAAGSTP